MSKEISLDEIKKFWPEKAPDINTVQKYVSKYEKEKIVIKYGGNVSIDRNVFNNFISDINVLNKLGLSIIVVHGGGPRIKRELDKKKIVSKFINGLRVTDKKIIDSAVADLSIIAGQKAMATFSKKDVSNFKLRKGMPIGTKVTLRGDKMYEFLDRLLSVALPRTRDFRGINPKGFDGRGNYNLGVKEHIIFPEIDIDKVNKILGMDITFVTSANTDEEALALLDAFGFPFKKN